MKKVKIITIILAIIVLTMVGFIGVYTQKQNRMENALKDYAYTMSLDGARTVRLAVNTETETVVKDADGNEVENGSELTDEEITQNGYTKEETKINKDEDLNQENYNKSKKVIEERLKDIGANEYVVKLDESTGDIIVELPENEATDSIISNVATTGKFEIIDSETKDVLMTNEDIKLANVMYGSDSTTTTTAGTTVYLNLEFTKEGSEKLKQISETYHKEAEDTNTTENTTTEETADAEETTTKEIIMQIDGEEIMSTSFDETIENGTLQLSIGSGTTDTDTLQDYVSQASSMAVILDDGNLPIEYTVEENEYILSDITQDQLNILAYVILAIAIIGLIILIFRFKTNGLVSAISYVGMVALYVILIRYTNVEISLEGILGIILTLVFNYILIYKLLVELKAEKTTKQEIKETITKTYVEFFAKIIPVAIAIIFFCFMDWMPISSFGMVMFWGIVLIFLYNYIVTNTLLKIKLNENANQ